MLQTQGALLLEFRDILRLLPLAARFLTAVVHEVGHSFTARGIFGWVKESTFIYHSRVEKAATLYRAQQAEAGDPYRPPYI